MLEFSFPVQQNQADWFSLTKMKFLGSLSDLFICSFFVLFEVLVSQESSFFSHNPREILKLKSVPFGRYLIKHMPGY